MPLHKKDLEASSHRNKAFETMESVDKDSHQIWRLLCGFNAGLMQTNFPVLLVKDMATIFDTIISFTQRFLNKLVYSATSEKITVLLEKLSFTDQKWYPEKKIARVFIQWYPTNYFSLFVRCNAPYSKVFSFSEGISTSLLSLITSGAGIKIMY